MKKIFTLLVAAFAFTMVMGQPTALIKKAETAPVVDGAIDDVWATVDPIAIETPHGTESPTTGESWWKMLWDDEGIYLLTFIEDDKFVPAYKGTVPGESWNYDKLEIYFDVNYTKKDGKGATNGSGHYQIAPTVKEDLLEGGATTESRGEVWAYNCSEDPHYYVEYFFPFTMLNDADGIQVDKTEPIGFDVNIMDNDNDDLTPSRNRMNWANAGAIAENWANMDDAGLITLDGAQAPTYVDDVQLPSGLSITEDNGTLQMVATITPEDATIKQLRWSVINVSGKASIDQNGLLTAIQNGTVSVRAAATDGMGAEAMVDVEISGQTLSQKEVWNTLNLIKNWNFDTDVASWGGWFDGATQIPAVSNDGIVVMSTDVNADGNQWHYQFNQSGLAAEPNVPYVLTFKSWSDVERGNTVDFEDTEGNGYTRYGATTDAESADGRSEWHYNTTTEPTWFVFHVTFDKILPNTVQKIQWMESQAAGIVYLDSVMLVNEEIYNMLPELPTSNKVLAKSISKVYPNPVGNARTLTVDLTSVNAKVAIYNALGQKLVEKTSEGNRVRFDVANLRKGMYFIKSEDGSVQKFVK